MAVIQEPIHYQSNGLMPGMVSRVKHPAKRLYYQRRMASSLALQTIIYYNVWYSILYFGLILLITGFKYRTQKINSQSIKIISPVLFSIWSVVEICRLVLAHIGNLQERVQHLAAFFFLSLFPQLLLVSYVVGLQPYPTPLEEIAGAIQITFLLAELIVGYHAIRYIIRVQATRFRLDYPYQSAVEAF
ncbi:hypothetical protein BVRB_031530 [Beta vulgaris subsp. vulgaris]|uniref:Transmembrane protein 17 n=1 Tax=Beta vulgaris subsp. vulgaris TaxID=3555 RepID=A0A0J8B0I9_BETVV|nr:hypothetical protein BVRB_031530 [Beta vulgaris subsp. vulgaris]